MALCIRGQNDRVWGDEGDGDGGLSTSTLQGKSILLTLCVILRERSRHELKADSKGLLSPSRPREEMISGVFRRVAQRDL
jgi:hypothetical protein